MRSLPLVVLLFTLFGLSTHASAGDLQAIPCAGVIEKISSLLEAHYVSREVVPAMTAALHKHLAQGSYRTCVGESFANLVTKHLRAVSHDLHLRLRYDDGADDSDSAEDVERADIEAKFGFMAVERLTGNVALLRLGAFVRGPDDKALVAAVAKNMSQVADADALILDLRENHGGNPATVALILSYLFDDKPVHLNDIWSREGGSTWHLWTQSKVEGKRFGGQKPIYVLVSKKTISGGEEAAYDLQTQKRAVLLGQATAGGANPAAPHEITAHLTLFVPFGRAINPITHTNWEGKGVRPEVLMDADAALDEAHRRAVRRLAAGRPGGSR